MSARDFETEAEQLGVLDFSVPRSLKPKALIGTETTPTGTDTSSEVTDDYKTVKIAEAYRTILEVRIS